MNKQTFSDPGLSLQSSELFVNFYFISSEVEKSNYF